MYNVYYNIGCINNNTYNVCVVLFFSAYLKIVLKIC